MTADTVGGVWTYSIELARALACRGIDVAIATMGPRMNSAQASQARHFTVFESDFALEWMDDPWEDVDRAGTWLLELEGRFAPDLVHLNGYCHGALPWTAPTLIVCHSCIASWYEAVRGLRAPASYRRYLDEVERGLQAADMVVAPTHAMLVEACRHYGPFARSKVIPNGRSSNAFRRGIKEPFIFTAGRLWDEAKNVAALDEIVGELPWPVYAAGEENGTGSLRRLGVLTESQIADWFGRASIYALPARYEPFGLSVLEGALSGCALVLGDIPSLRENWEGCALFVDPNRPEELRRALDQLISDPNLRRELGERAHLRGEEFGIERFAEGYVEAYGEVVECGQGALLG
jgi:glycosyltransferase involved in cell wall biosynthesis